MQKKSLLVALFCGALCLTGCLKNEESASVTQVRIAKANELNSIADLNKAKAQAEVIYANAEATIANAEAELKKAEAELKKAEAALVLVQAELLKVQVQLAEVKVEEEKVKLEMLQADLVSRLASLEVEIAAAEAAKQGWVNVLNNLLAQAEIDAIANAQEILDAEVKLEDYILTLEGQRADSAAYYSGIYFATLKEIDGLQFQVLQAKATRALVNQGAILAREVIYNWIEDAQDTIAMNQALIDALKERQTMTPEEAEAALKEAREELNEAYTNYRAALELEQSAKEAVDELNAKVSDFQKGWNEFTAVAPALFNDRSARYVANYPVLVEGINKVVYTTGVRVRTEEGVEFVPFWNGEVIDTASVRYPDMDVYNKYHFDHRHLDDITIVPAAINYDNIQDALDSTAAAKKRTAERNIAREERRMNAQIEDIKEDIKVWEDTIALHKAYLAARKDSVEKYETAFKKALAAAAGKDEAVNSAWDEFQLYMLTKYPTVSRSVFIARNQADTSYTHAKAKFLTDSTDIWAEWEDTLDLQSKVVPAFEAYAAALGKVNALEDDEDIADIWEDFDDICKDVWNPDFASNPNDPVLYDEGYELINEEEVYVYIYRKRVGNTGNWVYSAPSQGATIHAKSVADQADRDQYEAKIDYLAGWIDLEDKQEADADALAAHQALERAQLDEDHAYQQYVRAYEALVEALGGFPADLYAECNPDFNIFNYVTFPTPKNPDAKYGIRDGAWDEEEDDWNFSALSAEQMPGTTQLAVLDAVKAVLDARKTNAKVLTDFQDAKTIFGQAKLAYDLANAALIRALGGDPEKDDISKFLDQEAEAKYQKYLAALDETTDVYSSYFTLLLVYLNGYWDEVGPARPYDFPDIVEARAFNKLNFSWAISSYMVDPEATYLGIDGKDKSIAELIFGERTRRNNPYRRSLQWKVDQANNNIEVRLPAALARYTNEQNKEVEDYKEDAAAFMDIVNSFKPYEAGYNDWVTEREAAQDNYNEAKKGGFDAGQVYLAAKTLYDSVDAIANEGIYVYDPLVDGKNVSGYQPDLFGFVKIPVAKEIELLEKDNERLEARIWFLRNVLTDGKKVLAVVNEIIDEQIEQLDEQIEIKGAIALKYKEIMNAYLGIDDEEEVPSDETGPLEEEGDEE